jgi:Flp pilus assembly pilin Flp
MFNTATSMVTTFLKDDAGQDFAEYAMLLGAIGVVALAVLARFRAELIATFNAGIDALSAAR